LLSFFYFSKHSFVFILFNSNLQYISP
jgi:hypothetical protein